MPQQYTETNQENKGPSRQLQLVGFIIGEDRFALDILMVQEIIKTTTITHLPNSPEFIEGVINLRGNIIPVIDLSKRLNLPADRDEAFANTRIIIANVEDRVTGFMVDSVTKVLKIQSSDIELPPDIVTSNLESQYIEGVCEIDEKLVIILDFSRILEAGEIRKLKEIGQSGLRQSHA